MSDEWTFIKFGLIVTGKGEAQFAPKFLRAITTTKRCSFSVLRPIGQRIPIGADKQRVYIKTGKKIPDRDAMVGAQVRGWLLQDAAHRVLWIDDLEAPQRGNALNKFRRLRDAVDVMLNHLVELKTRFSVHFFVNMVEAYYLPCTEIVNEVLGVSMTPPNCDCENIRHPKENLKSAMKQSHCERSFHEKHDGELIVSRISLDEILSNPRTCRALRTLVAWCWETIGETRTQRFRLCDGIYWDVTASQLRDPPSPELIGPLDQVHR